MSSFTLLLGFSVPTVLSSKCDNLACRSLSWMIRSSLTIASQRWLNEYESGLLLPSKQSKQSAFLVRKDVSAPLATSRRIVSRIRIGFGSELLPLGLDRPVK